MNRKILINTIGLFAMLSTLKAFAIDSEVLRAKLVEIASKEAKIAKIGQNKLMMLYGVDSPIKVINDWNKIERKPQLIKSQIKEINELEKQKQQFIKSYHDETSAKL